MKSRLDQIEDRLRSFIEGSSALLPWGNRQQQLARRLVEAMQSAMDEQNGFVTAPGIYTIYLHPSNFETWGTRQDLFDALAFTLQEAAIEADLMLTHPPTMRLERDPALALDELRILPVLQHEETGGTHAMEAPVLVEAPEPVDPSPKNAFLIIEGVQTYPLRQAVLNIGRKLDNHLVINDPRVSRNHAQLRAAHGRYILCDLNSTGGTYVNGQRVMQQMLKPGDVISLAGYTIIFGEDNSISDGDTGPSTASWPAVGR